MSYSTGGMGQALARQWARQARGWPSVVVVAHRSLVVTRADYARGSGPEWHVDRWGMIWFRGERYAMDGAVKATDGGLLRLELIPHPPGQRLEPEWH